MLSSISTRLRWMFVTEKPQSQPSNEGSTRRVKRYGPHICDSFPAIVIMVFTYFFGFWVLSWPGHHVLRPCD